LLSILFSSGLFVIFKFFGIYKIDVLKAIVVNYIVAFTLGFLFSESNFSIVEVPNQPWFLGAIFLGILFVSIFFVMAMTSQNNGVSVASVAGKMSVVIPVFFGVFLYDESFSFLKIIGIIIALIAVYLTSVKEEKSTLQKKSLLFPMLLFLGSGTIDTALKYLEINFVSQEDVSIFSGSLFGIAAFFGLLILLFREIKQPSSFGIKNIIAGVLLGVPNYFSIIFLIKSLQTKGFESSMLFTINNVGIVVLSTIFGIILFKEHFSLKNKIGIALAIFGIVIVALS
jgi:drug/metabolite transporter (DMT)-like permease